ncbi:unnamed protein product, partial [Rotaria sp. Silwood1]
LSFLIRNENERVHRGGINALRYDAKNDRLYTAGRDSIIRAWDCKRYGSDMYEYSMEHHTDWVNDIVLVNSGKHILSASSDATIKLWKHSKTYHNQAKNSFYWFTANLFYQLNENDYGQDLT